MILDDLALAGQRQHVFDEGEASVDHVCGYLQAAGIGVLLNEIRVPLGDVQWVPEVMREDAVELAVLKTDGTVAGAGGEPDGEVLALAVEELRGHRHESPLVVDLEDANRPGLLSYLVSLFGK